MPALAIIAFLGSQSHFSPEDYRFLAFNGALLLSGLGAFCGVIFALLRNLRGVSFHCREPKLQRHDQSSKHKRKRVSLELG